MSTPWIFICPSTRGISNALLRHLIKTTPPQVPILCTYRPSTSSPSALLSSLPSEAHARLRVEPLDLLSESSISSLSSGVASSIFPAKTHHLALALTLPGALVNAERASSQIDYDAALETFKLNSLAPMMLIKHFSRFLPSKTTELPAEPVRGLPGRATWVCTSARVGSVSDNKLGGWYSYRASKAALNSVVKTFDIELERARGKNAMAVGYHPGTVKTDLSREFWQGRDMFSPEEAAEKMYNVVMGLEAGQRGRCWDWKGEEVLP